VVLAAVVAAVLWYATRGAARIWPPAAHLVARLSPWTSGLHQWVLSAPASFCYVVVFTASTIIQRSAPPQLIQAITTYQSTNLTRLAADPVRVLVASSLWVDERGFGLAGYVVVFATVVAWAERRYGTPRTIVIGYSAHVFGSLLTAGLERLAIDSHHAPVSLAYDSDVGVSYVMVGCCAAAVLALSGRARVVVGGLLLLAVETPVLLSHTFFDLGHLLATLIGGGTAALLLAVAPLRPVEPWKPVSAAASARAAPAPARGGATPCRTDPVRAPSEAPAASSVAGRPSVRS
jgi:hypothetical protein